MNLHGSFSNTREEIFLGVTLILSFFFFFLIRKSFSSDFCILCKKKNCQKLFSTEILHLNLDATHIRAWCLNVRMSRMFYSAASMMHNRIKISICLYIYTTYWAELIMAVVHYLSLIIAVPECLKIAICKHFAIDGISNLTSDSSLFVLLETEWPFSHAGSHY